MKHSNAHFYVKIKIVPGKSTVLKDNTNITIGFLKGTYGTPTIEKPLLYAFMSILEGTITTIDSEYFKFFVGC